jgi:hypothetical protein
MDSKVTTTCDECERQMPKIFRFHKGRRYCANCYKREFKKRLCSKCGNVKRLLVSEPAAICLQCERTRPCTRCGKTSYKIGRMTAYGPVCASCAPHYDEPQECKLCGKESKRFTKVSRLGIDYPVCHRCARSDFRTCQGCKKHRLLSLAPDGRLLCKICAERGEIPCPVCGESMPAGSGKRCEKCYWQDLLKKRVSIDCVALALPVMAGHFSQFGEWLGNTVGYRKAAITVNRYLLFFTEIEETWRAIPDYKTLLEHFGAERLRRVSIPMRWLVEIGLITVDSRVRGEDSERKRIEAALEKFRNGTVEGKLLEGYCNRLRGKMERGKANLLSVRLALTPAMGLLQIGLDMGVMPPDQKVLDLYLTEKPGQRAALSGFVGYLKQTRQIVIGLPKKSEEAAEKKRERLRQKLVALLRDGKSQRDGLEGIKTALCYFHDLSRKMVRQAARTDIAKAGEGGVTVSLGGKGYWIPMDFVPKGLLKL